MPALPRTQVAGVYHRRIGEAVLTTLCDGYLEVSLDVVNVITQAEAEAMVTAALRPLPARITVDMFALHIGGRLALIDAGSADTMGPTLGRLPESMAAAGIEPGDIDTILLTHMHPDHSNGLTDPSGRMLFPNAEIVLHETELAHWLSDDEMARATERQRERYFKSARFQIAPYLQAGRVRTVREGEVYPGVTIVPCPGHTPGHSAYRIAAGSETAIVWGDTVHIPEIQVPRPEVTFLFDYYPDMAAQSRRRIFDMAVDEGLLVAGMHLHFPGFARMVRANGSFALVPDAWSVVL